LGATICLPRNPQCLLCPVARFCKAYQTGRQTEFPVKLVSQKKVDIQRRLFWIEDHSKGLLLWQRPVTARLMPGFWELPEAEHLPQVVPGAVLGTFRHSITYHRYQFEVCRAEAGKEVGECRWIDKKRLASLPISTILRKARKIVHLSPTVLGASV
jgi:A/G-specific adenine glycosylase